MKTLLTILAFSVGISASARTIHCSDDQNVRGYLRFDIDEGTLTGKIELKGTQVNQLPEKLLGIGSSSLGYIGLLTVATANVKCFFSKDAGEAITCDSGPNGAGNGNFSEVQVEGDTDLRIPEINNVRVNVAKNILIAAGGNRISYLADVSIAKYNPSGPDKTFHAPLHFKNCQLFR